MIKIISFVLFTSLILNVQCSFAKETIAPQSDKSNYTYDVDENYDFEKNSYNISDEQMKELESMGKIEDDNDSFWKKIINSSHFSSDTATKTWIPINKEK